MSPTAALSYSASSFAAEAQRLMAMSINKIVASRNRRGGVSLHRNLLVAGVLFRARDALLATGKMPSLSSSSVESSGSSPPPETPSQNTDEASNDNTNSPSTSFSESPSPQSRSSPCSGSTAGTSSCHDEPSVVDSQNHQHVDEVEVVGKENVPPMQTTSSSTNDCSKRVDTERSATFDHDSNQPPSGNRKRRHSDSSTQSCSATAVKSSRTNASTSSGTSSTSSSDVQTRSSSMSACHTSVQSNAAVAVPSKPSYACRSDCRDSTVSPVVYLNRIDVAFCSSSGVNVTGMVRPVLVVQVV